jgi:hypothetical protein
MLQAGRSLDRMPISLDFFNLPKPSSLTMALGFTQPLTGIFLAGKALPARKADNLIVIREPIV